MAVFPSPATGRAHHPSEQGAHERAARLDDPLVLGTDDLEQLDEAGADLLPVLVGQSPHEVDEARERVLDVATEEVEVGDDELGVDVDWVVGDARTWTPVEGGFTHATELVELARTRVTFRIGVAAFPEKHPASTSLDQDADVLAAKARAGAEFAVTQMFFRADDYFGLLERLRSRGVDIPVLPGIMPILNLKAIRRQGELIGTDVPTELVERIQAHEADPVAMRAEGIAIAAELCRELLEGGAPGLHFYTLNRSRATREIFEQLNITV